MLITDLEDRYKNVFSGSMTTASCWTGVSLQTGVNDDKLEPPVVIFFANKASEEITGTAAYKIDFNIQIQTPGNEPAATHIARCRELEKWLHNYLGTGSYSYAALATELTSGSLKVYGVVPTETSETTVEDKYIYNISLATFAQPLNYNN